jgi:hypothetical protein
MVAVAKKIACRFLNLQNFITMIRNQHFLLFGQAKQYKETSEFPIETSVTRCGLNFRFRYVYRL